MSLQTYVKVSLSCAEQKFSASTSRFLTRAITSVSSQVLAEIGKQYIMTPPVETTRKPSAEAYEAIKRAIEVMYRPVLTPAQRAMADFLRNLMEIR